MLQEKIMKLHNDHMYNIVELKEENNQKPIKRTQYIDGDLLFSKIAGHSDYHGDNILSAISCLQEGKEISMISAIGDNEWV